MDNESRPSVRELSRKTKDFLASLNITEEKWHDNLENVVRDFRKKGYSEEDTITKLLTVAPESCKESATDYISEYFNRRETSSARNNRPAVEDWVKEWLQRESASMVYAREEVYLKGEAVPMEILVSRLFLDSERRKHFYSKDAINSVLTLWKDEVRKKTIKEHCRSLEYDPNLTDSEIRKLVKITTGKIDEWDVLLWKHWIWLTQRSLRAMPTKYQVMLVLMSTHHGAGKSYLIENKIVAPLKELTEMNIEMSALYDSREYGVLGKLYIGVLDELSKASKGDIESIKNKITSTYVSYRVLGTNNRNSVPKTMNFIGTSNKPISDIFYDPDGMRRFWQFDCVGFFDHQQVASLNPEKIWKCVDYNQPSPIEGNVQEMYKIQNSRFRAKCSLEQYILENCEKGNWEEKKTTPVKGLYDNYLSWMRWQQNRNNYGYYQFIKRLEQLGYRVEKNRVCKEVDLIILDTDKE